MVTENISNEEFFKPLKKVELDTTYEKERIRELAEDIRQAQINFLFHKKQMEYFEEEIKTNTEYIEYLNNES